MFTDCYCTQFRRTSHSLTRIYDDALRPLGMRITQFTLLRSLARLGDSTVTELAIEGALERSTMSRNIKLLIEAGWVDVLPAEDRREKLLRLNDTGRAALKKAMPLWRVAQQKVEAYTNEFFKTPTNEHLLRALENLQAATADLLDEPNQDEDLPKARRAKR